MSDSSEKNDRTIKVPYYEPPRSAVTIPRVLVLEIKQLLRELITQGESSLDPEVLYDSLNVWV